MSEGTENQEVPVGPAGAGEQQSYGSRFFRGGNRGRRDGDRQHRSNYNDGGGSRDVNPRRPYNDRRSQNWEQAQDRGRNRGSGNRPPNYVRSDHDQNVGASDDGPWNRNKHQSNQGYPREHNVWTSRGSNSNRSRNNWGYDNNRKQAAQETKVSPSNLSNEGVNLFVESSDTPIPTPSESEVAMNSLNPAAVEFRPGFSNIPAPAPTETQLNETFPDKSGGTEEYVSDSSFNEPPKVDQTEDLTESSFDDTIDQTASSLQDSTLDSSNASYDSFNNTTVSPNTSGKLQGGKYKETKNASHHQWERVERGDNITRNDNSSNKSSAFETFDNKYYSSLKRNTEFKVVEEIEGDLFAMDKSYALGNCVAVDLNMGSGIAVQFRQEFKNVGELSQQRPKVGGIAFLNHEGRFIYYLVTKRESTGKPTYETMYRSVEKLMEHMVENDVKKLAIPRLGCGLDRLEWNKVKAMLEYVFKDTDVKITVCNFQKADETMSKKKENLQFRRCAFYKVPEPIEKVEPYTIIVYLGTVDGHVDKNMEELERRFKITRDYRNARRELGTYCTTNIENFKYYLVGCIVKVRKSDDVDFKAFEQCLRALKKENEGYRKTGDEYNKVAIQTYTSATDDQLMSLLQNMMRNTLYKVTITQHGSN